MALTATSDLLSGALLVGTKRINDTALGSMPHVNPATGQPQATVPLAGPEEIDLAVAVARSAFPEWRRWTADARRAVLFELADAIERHADEFAEIGMLENGTPISFGAFACAGAPADWFRYYAGWVDKLEGRVVPTYPLDALNYTLHEPYGVVGVLSAFNAPAFFLGMKVAPALAAGNTVVLKPSELAPFTSVRFGELCLEVGLPPGVVNVVPGDGRAGAALAGHPAVDRVTFTGSGRTARHVLAAAAEHLTPVNLELGGKSACLIFADSDLDEAISTAVKGGLAMQSGQACVAGSRVLVERAVYEEVRDTIVEIARSLEVGDPAEPGTLLGPVINQFHCERILGVVSDAGRCGAGELLTGGGRLGGPLADGYFVEPTVFGHVDPKSSLAQEEVFGPVLSLIPFDTEAEAVEIANRTTYGLAGYVFTNDLKRAHRLARDLEAGYISVNTFNMLPPTAPFGGYKQSGFGREGGLEGLLEMTQTKNVHVSLEQ